MSRPLDPALTRRWIEPCLTDAAIRGDTAAFLKGVDNRELLDVSTRLERFTKPVLLLWGDADRFFKLEFAMRLSRLFPDARLVEIPGGRTFHPLDDPGRVAGLIQDAFYAGGASRSTPSPTPATTS